MLLGVDVGGTFTDAAAVDGPRLFTAKTPTTPEDQSVGVLAAIRAVLDQASARPADVDELRHGMTVATNALLEGRTARTVLCATAGFVDLVELGRQDRPHLYDLSRPRVAALTPPSRRVAVRERCGPDGPEEPLTAEEAARAAAEAAAHGPEAVAVVLLHADRHPEHERLLGRALRDALGPDVHVSLSHSAVGTFREYERAATTEVDAAVSPLVGRYLRRLARRCAEAGLPEPAILGSSGGVSDLETAAARGATTVLSGPAGGAAAAAMVARASGEPDLLCFDMGGTSCDVLVVADGRVRETGGGAIAGRPIALPTVDIHTVGAGGGSVAWADPGGALRVGPRSSGAVPGPAAYGRGGTEPTVTDAHVVLGTLAADEPLAGDVALDRVAARAAVGRLADRLGLDLEACARGILRVADAEMARALRVMTVERGVDPRDFALLAYGGAGGLHAAGLAARLGMRRVLVPRAGGVLSALGLAAADRREDRARTVLLRGAAITAAALAAPLDDDADHGADAEAPIRTPSGGSARPDGPELRTERAYDARYAGQAFELTLRDCPPEPAALRRAFDAAHRERYGFDDPDAELELVTIRETRRRRGPAATLGGPAADGAGADDAAAGGAAGGGAAGGGAAGGGAAGAGAAVGGCTDPGSTGGGSPDPRSAGGGSATREPSTASDDPVVGPAVVRLPGSTVVVPAGWTATVDGHGTLRLEADDAVPAPAPWEARA